MPTDTSLAADTYPARPGDTAVEPRSRLHHRWSPVRFRTDRDVDRDDLTAILEAARWAASCFGEEPWRFLVARRDAGWRDAVEEALDDGNAWAKRASVLMVGVTKRTFTKTGELNRYARHDLGMALTSMMTESAARGLATHAMAGFDAEAVRERFQIPEDFDVVWTLALGHHDPGLDDGKLAARETRDRRRRPLDTLVFGDRFDAEPRP